MRISLIVLLLTISIGSFGQKKSLKGFVIDSSTNQPLHGAHIQNVTADKLVVTEPNGYFDMPLLSGDSIVITYIGYEPYSLLPTHHIDSTLTIGMKPSSVELIDVVITPFPAYEIFKQIILEVDPPDSSISMVLPKVDKYAFYDSR